MIEISNFSFLVVDDSPVNQAILMHRLTRLGGNVLLAGNGKEALQRCAEQRFDLIFLDIQMPELDGFSTVEQIKKLYPSTCVIAWTCSIDESSVSFFEAGFDGYLDKPIHKQSFLSILSEHLGIQDTTTAPSGINSEFVVAELTIHSKEIVTVHSGFLSTLPDKVLELKQLSDLQNWEELTFQTRKLRGTAKLNSLVHLSEMLLQIEKSARAVNHDATRDNLNALMNAVTCYLEENSNADCQKD